LKHGFATQTLPKVKVYEEEETPTHQQEVKQSPICSYNEWDPLEVANHCDHISLIPMTPSVFL